MMQNSTLRYFIYARKSSESEDRQMASIEDQLKEVNKIATELNLTVIGVFSESKSAKAPGRNVFNDMLSQIEQGKADGILCWKLNRLARNPVDGGRISWLLQNNTIKHIQCYGRDYKPSDNVLMMQVEFGMANQFVKDLSVDIKRGAVSKAERGWYPSSTLPIGYLHNKENNKKVCEVEITTDKERIDIIKRLWKLMLTGNYSIAKIKKIGDELGFVGRNNHEYSKSSYHKFFSNEFYCGYFYWKDSDGIRKRYKGKHEAIITEQEFDKVQYIIGNKKRKTRSKQYEYPYTGMISCGECGCSITAERKHQVKCTTCRHKFSCMHRDDCPKCNTKIKEMVNPTITDITYYRCTKRKQPCSQKFITEKDLEKQFLSLLKGIEISEDFYTLLCNELEKLDAMTRDKDQKILSSIQKKIAVLEKRKSSLLKMRADNEISSDDYLTFKTDCEQKTLALEKQMRNFSYSELNWLTIALDYINLAKNAVEIFRKSDYLGKKNLLRKLGSNQHLMDKKLYFIRAKPLLAILNCYAGYRSIKSTFEPENRLEKQSDFTGLCTQSSVWWSGVKHVRTTTLAENTLLECA